MQTAARVVCFSFVDLAFMMYIHNAQKHARLKGECVREGGDSVRVKVCARAREVACAAMPLVDRF